MRGADLLGRLSLEEKIGQMLQLDDHVLQMHAGSVLHTSPELIRRAGAGKHQRAGCGGSRRQDGCPAKVEAVKALLAQKKTIAAITENQGMSRANVCRALNIETH